MTGVVGIFLPYSRTLDMIIAGAGCLLFSAYIIYDTHMLLNRLSPDEWVLACVSLYLEYVHFPAGFLLLPPDPVFIVSSTCSCKSCDCSTIPTNLTERRL